MRGLPMSTFNAHTLPDNDNVNDYAFSIALAGEWFISKGAMIAYYGNINFDAVTRFASQAAWAAAQFSSPVYVQDWVVAAGQGKLIVADRGFNVNSFDLENGNLTIKASNLLGFDRALELIASGKVDLKPLITGTFDFSRSIEAFERAAKGNPSDVKLQIRVGASG